MYLAYIDHTFERLALYQVHVVRLPKDSTLEAAHQTLQIAVVDVKI